MKITWLGHSAFRVEIGSSIIMIDPFLSANPLFQGNVAEVSAGTTHVILTHGHDDHIGDTVTICKANNARLIAVFELCNYLNVEQSVAMNMGGTLQEEEFDISFVRADHSSSSDGVYLGNPCGVIIRAKKEPQTLYHMGDTDIFGDMALIQELYHPTIGIVPIGDRFTMSPFTAALACQRYFNFVTIFPCHYKTFPPLVQTADDFVKAMGEASERVCIPAIGETVER